MFDPKKKSLNPLKDYPPVVGQMLWSLEDTRRRTLNVLKDISQAVIDWIPPHEHNSIGTLLYHIPLIETSWLYEDVLQREMPALIEPLFPDHVRDEQEMLTLIEGVSLEEHLVRMQTVRTTLLEEFKAITSEDFNKPRSVEDYTVTPAWVLHHLSQHEAEHRGQIQETRLYAEEKLNLHS